MTTQEQIARKMIIAANGDAVCLDEAARFNGWVMYNNHGAWVSKRPALPYEIMAAKRQLSALRFLKTLQNKDDEMTTLSKEYVVQLIEELGAGSNWLSGKHNVYSYNRQPKIAAMFIKAFAEQGLLELIAELFVLELEFKTGNKRLETLHIRSQSLCVLPVFVQSTERSDVPQHQGL